MAVTLPHDEGYSSSFRLSAYFELPGAKCKRMSATSWKFLNLNLNFSKLEAMGVRRELLGGLKRLEEERAAARQAHGKQPPSGGRTVSGAPLYQKQHPKCANPACPTAFHWTGGGKFFPVSARSGSNQWD
jgi:hypothetical protein